MPNLARTLALGTAAALMAGAPPPASAQRVDPHKVIELHINAERQNQSFRGSIMEGGQFRLTFNDTNRAYAISVVQQGPARFAITVLRVDSVRSEPTFTPIETVTATTGQPAPLHSLPYVTVVVEGTRRTDRTASAFPAVRPAFASYANLAFFFDRCCLTCGNVTACACAVYGDCGWCCSGACCPPVNDPGFAALVVRGRSLAELGKRPCHAIPASERLYPQFALPPGSERIASR